MTSILDKLQKLLNMRDGAEAIGSVKEAAAFGAKIQALLVEHKLSLSDIEGKQEEEAGADMGSSLRYSEFLKDKVRGMMWEKSTTVIPWLRKLAHTIAEVNDCKMVIGSIKHDGKWISGNVYRFVGIEADRLVAEEFFRYMVSLCWDLSEIEVKDNRVILEQLTEQEHGKGYHPNCLGRISAQFRQSFCMGFADAVCERLYAVRAEMMKKAAGEQVSNALVLVDRRLALVDKFIAANTVQSKGAKYSRGQFNDHGYQAGKERGNAVALTSKTLR